MFSNTTYNKSEDISNNLLLFFSNDLPASLSSQYSCGNPTLHFPPCANHGSCYVMFDPSANDQTNMQLTALSYNLTTYTVQTLPAAIDLTGVELNDLSSMPPLPASVCVCESGYTGQSDFIQRNAFDHATCSVNETALQAELWITFMLVLVALFLSSYKNHAFWRWFLTLRKRTVYPVIVITSARETQTSSEVQSTVTPLKLHSSPEPAQVDPSSVDCLTANNSNNVTRVEILSSTLPIPEKIASPPASKKVEFVKKNMRYQLFRQALLPIHVHSAHSIMICISALLLIILKVSTTQLIGRNAFMNLLYFIVITIAFSNSLIAVHSTSKATLLAIKHMLHGNSATVALLEKLIHATRKVYAVIVPLCLLSNLIVFFLPYRFMPQDIGSSCMLSGSGFAWLTLGVWQVWCVTTLIRALQLSKDNLSGIHKKERQAVIDSTTKYIKSVLILVIMWFSIFLFGAVPYLLVYIQFVWPGQICCFAMLIISRMLLLQTPKIQICANASGDLEKQQVPITK